MAYTITNNARIDVGVINDHIEQLVEPGMRKHILLAMMRKRGRLKFNCHSKARDWRIKYKRTEPVPHDDMSPINFVRVNRHKDAVLPWRSYAQGEFFTKYEKLVSQNPKTALIKIVDNLTGEMTSDINEYFHLEAYNDGYENTDRLHGLESMFGHTGSVITNSPAYAPSDTYGGLSTTLGNYGGTWSTGVSNAYPMGTGDLQYQFWSPLILDEEASFWDSTTKTWKGGTWRETIRFANTYQETLHSKIPDFYLMTAEKLRLAKQSMDDKERVIVTSGSEVADLGFKTMKFEGVDLLSEYGVPDGAAYGIYVDSMELCSMQSKLFMIDQEDDIVLSSRRLAIDFYGNMRFKSPAHFVKIMI